MAGEFSDTLDWVKSYEAGLAAWRAGDFTAAIDAFEKARELRPDDAASSLMIERCKRSGITPRARIGTAQRSHERNSPHSRISAVPCNKLPFGHRFAIKDDVRPRIINGGVISRHDDRNHEMIGNGILEARAAFDELTNLFP